MKRRGLIGMLFGIPAAAKSLGREKPLATDPNWRDAEYSESFEGSPSTIDDWLRKEAHRLKPEIRKIELKESPWTQFATPKR